MKEIQLKYKWEDLPAASVALVESSGFAVRMKVLILKDESLDASADLCRVENGSIGASIGQIAQVTAYQYWESRHLPLEAKQLLVKHLLEAEVARLINAKWGQQA